MEGVGEEEGEEEVEDSVDLGPLFKVPGERFLITFFRPEEEVTFLLAPAKPRRASPT